MLTPIFRDHPSFKQPRHGPLLGRKVLAVVAPLDCDARGVRGLWRALRPLGIRLGVTMECHGEARGEDGRALFPDCLLIEVRAEEWDALVFAGGRGAANVAEDPLARELAKRFAATGKTVAALDEGRRVLVAAGIEPLIVEDPATLAESIAVRLGAKRRGLTQPYLARLLENLGIR